MSQRKHARIEHDWCHLFSVVNLDRYLNDIDRGLMKFVNRKLYQKYKGFEINYSVMLLNISYFQTSEYWNLATWYQEFTGNKFSRLINNADLIIKYDYPMLYQLYFMCPKMTRRLHDKVEYMEHIQKMIDADAIKCIDLMMNTSYEYVWKNIYYAVKEGNIVIFRKIMDKVKEKKQINYRVDIVKLMHLCINKHHEHILEDIIDRYGFKPDYSVIKRVKGPHFNCYLCQAIVEHIV